MDKKLSKTPSNISKHANKRAQQRGISKEKLDLVIAYGRMAYRRGALIYALGRKEIKRFGKKLPDLKELNGLQVVTSVDTGSVITCYRNKSFKGLR